MGIAAIVVVAALGVGTTAYAALRMWRASRGGAPRELVIGYLVLMLLASLASLLLLRSL